ncbi:MAG TPA: hypothetical protein IGS53_09410 [Leptolyngbyaceae cyanobacterium M33_DOE_097]|uniref:Uncharacterized protein n=1 Tax=Oscillatoriales cyanobacterium SpSt-418 TaxID=2282169 RepID=A0A7C3KEP2_9CYAN|nr:hypothetical protein [Leptolyngbyaceae cyanobacterium M33_DOE_097]
MLAELTPTEVGQRAIAFLMDDLAIPLEDQEWFSVLGTRLVGETWYVVEIGVEGLPDKWVLQIYDTGECDPSYTFNSPVQATEADTGLEDLPEAIADILATERSQT